MTQLVLCMSTSLFCTAWLFEAQDSDVITKLLGSSEVDFGLHIGYVNTPTRYVVTPFDCFVLGYCVSNSQCIWKIWFGPYLGIRDHIDCCIGDEGMEMLVHGHAASDPGSQTALVGQRKSPAAC